MDPPTLPHMRRGPIPRKDRIVTDLVPADSIETIVGRRRHPVDHLRAGSARPSTSSTPSSAASAAIIADSIRRTATH